MGTRNLTCVMTGGEYKVAQYGQWDGYPSGQGLTALEFLRNTDMEAFKAKVAAARWITGTEIEELNETNWQKTHPQLSRDRGAEILEMVNDAEPGIVLLNSIDFAGDSLFCEWAYVIDFDKGTFEVFKGFNQKLLAEGDRFFGFEKVEAHRSEQYHPVKLLHAFQLDSLPTNEEFLAICEPRDEDEEE